jgi:DNA anti-recombination protein RmuC
MLSLALVSLGTTIGVVVVAAHFVKKQRLSLVRSLNESAKQHLGTAQQLANAIETMQRQQRQHEQQLQNVAQATLRLRQDVVTLNKRVEREQSEVPLATGDRVIH